MRSKNTKIPSETYVMGQKSKCTRCSKISIREFRTEVPYRPEVIGKDKAALFAKKGSVAAVRIFLREPYCSTCEAALSPEDYKELMARRRQADRDATTKNKEQ